MSVVCTHCGAQAENNSGFCPNCGRGLASANDAETFPAAAEPGVSPDPGSVAPAIAAGQANTWTEATTKPFLHEGAWYANSNGVVLRWEPASSAWATAPEAELPEFMRQPVISRPAFSSLKTPAVWLYILLGAFAFLTLVALIADALAYDTFDRRAGGEFISREDRDNALGFFFAMKGFQYVVILGIAAMFLWWTRRATCNVPALGAANPEFTPGWAIGWWFIPFANWVQPVRVLSQAWRAADPSLPLATSDGWRKAKLTPLLPVWWIAYMVGSGVWAIAWSSIDDGTMPDRDVSNYAAFTLAMDIAMVVVTALTIWVVAALTRRQGRAHARFESKQSG